MKLNQIISSPSVGMRTPILTGFSDMDHYFTGLRAGEIFTIGGRPGLGKTAMALSLLGNIALNNKVPTVFFSLEQNHLVVADRLKRFIRRGFEVNGADLVHDSIPRTLSMMAEAPLWIEHNAKMTMDEIIARMASHALENGVRLVVIDSLQWIYAPADSVGHAQDLLKLREAAERLQVAVVLTSNLDRACENRRCGYRPSLNDLSYGNWQNTDTYSSAVMLIYRPEYYFLETFFDDEPCRGKAEIMVVKNNFGGCGYFRLRYDDCDGFSDFYFDDAECHPDALPF